MKIIQNKDISQQLYYELTPERLAILGTIAFCEGTDRSLDKVSTGYNILYGFQKFTPGVDHPRKIIHAGGISSSAAGRYQILDRTWDWMQTKLRDTGFSPFPSFSPVYQDQAGLFLIDAKRDAIAEVDAGNLDGFLKKCNREWASLPGSPYGQPVVNLEKVHKIYSQLLKLWGET